MNWKRVVGWAVVGFLGLILLLVAGAAFLLHSPKFHRYVISRVEQTASDSLNAQVRIRNFNLNLHDLTVINTVSAFQVYEAKPHAQ